jgi:ribosome maturation protein SDO1
MIESALRDIHFSVDPKRSAKQQALEALPKLQEIFPIKRAEMRFAAVVPSAKEESLMAFVRENSGKVETNDLSASEASVTFTMDPSTYRALDKLVKECKGRLEVVTLAVTDETTTSGTFDQDTMKATAAKQTAMEKAEEALSKIEISRPVVQPMAPTQTRATQLETLSASDANILVPRGPIADLPEEHASRKERFADLDKYQPGWEVELRAREGSSIVDAVFYSPDGELAKTYAEARRKAMTASK